VTDAAAVERGVARAFEELGRIDVVFSNAGFGVLGAVEELDDDLVTRHLPNVEWFPGARDHALGGRSPSGWRSFARWTERPDPAMVAFFVEMGRERYPRECNEVYPREDLNRSLERRSVLV